MLRPRRTSNFFENEKRYPKFERFWPTTASDTLRVQLAREAVKFEESLRDAEI